MHLGDGVNQVTLRVSDSIEAPMHTSYDSTLDLLGGSSFDFKELLFCEGSLEGGPNSITLSVRHVTHLNANTSVTLLCYIYLYVK